MQGVAKCIKYFTIGEGSCGNRTDRESGLHLDQPQRHYLGLVDAAEVDQCSRAHPIRRTEPRMCLRRAVRRGGRFLEAAGHEMSNRNGHMADIAHWIERAEPKRFFGLTDCYLALAAPCPGDSTEAENDCR